MTSLKKLTGGTQDQDNFTRSRKTTTYQSKGCILRFKDISVTIDKKDILKDVSGVALPGEMLAIMGPSGAGKTTLLNCLAGRREVEKGTLTLDSEPLDKRMRRRISYVLQSDIFSPRLTCRETLWFTARLRLPQSMPEGDKQRRMNEVVKALDMEKCLDTKIGTTFDRGLSGGEKKRTNIACELLTNPALMLLDEPTSGLDSSTAYSLMEALKEFARTSQKTIVVTIHQPSSQIFHMFDKLLLLCDGQMAYFGEVEQCYDYFSSIGLICPSTYNLADYILDQAKATEDIKDKIISSAIQQRSENRNLLMLMDANKELQTTEFIESNGNNSYSMQCLNHETSCHHEHEQEVVSSGYVNGAYKPCDEENALASVHAPKSSSLMLYDVDFQTYQKEYEQKWPTGFWLQFSLLAMRSLKEAAPRILGIEMLLQIVVIAVFSGFLWFQSTPSEANINDRQGLLFFVMIFSSFTAMLTAIFTFPMERPIINKERLAGYYRLSAYVTAKFASELPVILVVPFLKFTIVFWLSGINYNVAVYFEILGVMMLASAVTQGIGQFYGALIENFNLAVTCGSTTMLCAMLAGGFYVKTVPEWATWMRYGAFTSHLFYIILHLDIRSVSIRCASVGSQFEFCRNATLNVAYNTTDVPYIPVQDLLEVYTLSGVGFEIWHHLMILLGLCLLPRLALYIVLRYIRKPIGN